MFDGYIMSIDSTWMRRFVAERSHADRNPFMLRIERLICHLFNDIYPYAVLNYRYCNHRFHWFLGKLQQMHVSQESAENFPSDVPWTVQHAKRVSLG
jgi:hypothetical protein